MEDGKENIVAARYKYKTVDGVACYKQLPVGQKYNM